MLYIRYVLITVVLIKENSHSLGGAEAVSS